jgi:hypothetical protein
LEEFSGFTKKFRGPAASLRETQKKKSGRPPYGLLKRHRGKLTENYRSTPGQARGRTVSVRPLPY